MSTMRHWRGYDLAKIPNPVEGGLPRYIASWEDGDKVHIVMHQGGKLPIRFKSISGFALHLRNMQQARILPTLDA